MTERGSALPALAGLIAVVTTLVVATAGLAAVYAAREMAVTGADAAALAAAVATYPPAGGDDAPEIVAGEVAAANGSVLRACKCPIDTGMAARTVTVTTSVLVEVPVLGRVTVRASSRAEFDPVRWLGG